MDDINLDFLSIAEQPPFRPVRAEMKPTMSWYNRSNILGLASRVSDLGRIIYFTLTPIIPGNLTSDSRQEPLPFRPEPD